MPHLSPPCVMKTSKLFRLFIYFIGVAFSSSGFLGCLCADVGPPKQSKSGDITVNIEQLQGTATKAGKNYVSVSYSGNLAEGTGDTGETAFDVQRSYEIEGPSVHPNPSVTRRGMKYGRWSVRVQANSWTAECSCNLSSSASPRFVFTYPNTKGECR